MKYKVRILKQIIKTAAFISKVTVANKSGIQMHKNILEDTERILKQARFFLFTENHWVCPSPNLFTEKFKKFTHLSHIYTAITVHEQQKTF